MEVPGCEETNNKIIIKIDGKNMLNLTQMMKYCVLQKENHQRLSFKWLNLV